MTGYFLIIRNQKQINMYKCVRCRLYCK